MQYYPLAIPTEGQIDFQAEALIPKYGLAVNYYTGNYFFDGESSGWSNIRNAKHT